MREETAAGAQGTVDEEAIKGLHIPNIELAYRRVREAALSALRTLHKSPGRAEETRSITDIAWDGVT